MVNTYDYKPLYLVPLLATIVSVSRAAARSEHGHAITFVVVVLVVVLVVVVVVSKEEVVVLFSLLLPRAAARRSRRRRPILTSIGSISSFD